MAEADDVDVAGLVIEALRCVSTQVAWEEAVQRLIRMAEGVDMVRDARRLNRCAHDGQSNVVASPLPFSRLNDDDLPVSLRVRIQHEIDLLLEAAQLRLERDDP